MRLIRVRYSFDDITLQSCAAAYEDTLEVLRLKVVNGDRLAHDDIGLEVYAHLAQVVNLHIDNLVRQTEFGNAIFQHSAYLVQGLEDMNVVA